ncbi:hypothetical protein XEUV354_22940 [Xanthomonas euvesicatoria]|nr:hypothetical protein BHE83_06110 [Xanthomonas euvesicatoria pv. vesicatoria str. 85-10]APO90239.1 hypothetical protein BJD11_09430 [Xanthomonas euvesicatoria]KLA49279.1 hypothetical protein XEUV683_22820 [Xanthomonas euvesicatoria]KLA49386.1 hypothetical protein XEUV685_22700 [Xanthomonas euvesicatoria]KLA60403.1 hypothetical protein XEUV684_09035 [Xanthomonas euvesicatoria]
MPLEFDCTTAGQRIGDALDMLECAHHTAFGMCHRRPAVIHRRITLQALKLRNMGLSITDFVAKEILDAWANIVGAKAKWRIGVQIAINKSHTHCVAEGLYTCTDASQGIGVASYRSGSIRRQLQAPQSPLQTNFIVCDRAAVMGRDP